VSNSTSSVLARWCGIAAIAAGVLHAAWGYLHTDTRDLYLMRADTSLLLRLIAIAVPLLFFIVLTGIYAQIARHTRLLGRIGFLIAFWGCGIGLVQGLVENTLLHRFFIERGWPGQLLRWLPLLLVGLVLIGMGAAKVRALGRWSTLLLVTALSGWTYYLTDTGFWSEIRSVHVVFGLLFSLCWIALGCALGAGQSLRE
jgi:hypothetical protein